MTTEVKVIGGIGLLTLIILVGGVFFLSKNDAKQQQKENSPLMGKEYPTSSQHIPRGEKHEAYNTNPPSSGPHWGDGTAGPGIKDTPVPDELLVHSLEHGAAILWYKEGLPQEQVEKLKTIFNQVSGKTIMVPRKNLSVPVAMTSWGRVLTLKNIDDKQIKLFLERNNGRAPEQAPI